MTHSPRTMPRGWRYTLAMQYLIDASVYVFRAYYSMPDDMVDDDGNPINALYGFCRFLGDFIEQVNPEHVAVAFDESLTTSFRTTIYPEYKANREPAPAVAVAAVVGAQKRLDPVAQRGVAGASAIEKRRPLSGGRPLQCARKDRLGVPWSHSGHG